LKNKNLSISFIGEVMLGREVGVNYKRNNKKIVSKEIVKKISSSDFVLANLEAPIAGELKDENDIMTFIADKKTLSEVKFIDAFSIANNHINDAETKGIEETIKQLNNENFIWNGFYLNSYKPILIEKKDLKCAVICCTDVLNIQISDENYKRKLLWLESSEIDDCIKFHKNEGYFVILYVHGGIMFSRYPNPKFREILHSKIDKGADLIVTVHPHVIGSQELYKDKLIFYSLGDFIMDGNSDRRRSSMILNVEIDKNYSVTYDLLPTVIKKDLTTDLAQNKTKDKLLKSWNNSSLKLELNAAKYRDFYKNVYRKEIFSHIMSTMIFQIKNKSFLDFVRILIGRFKDFKNMARWMFKDTSKMRNNLEDKNML
tara:strand:- start:179 stop:1294 length:1116 start_codon:yes stop_codon:yes gene_type:complete